MDVAVVVVDRFSIALFSVLKQTHCARMQFYDDVVLNVLGCRNAI